MLSESRLVVDLENTFIGNASFIYAADIMTALTLTHTPTARAICNCNHLLQTSDNMHDLSASCVRVLACDHTIEQAVKVRIIHCHCCHCFRSAHNLHPKDVSASQEWQKHLMKGMTCLHHPAKQMPISHELHHFTNLVNDKSHC